jgi:hypothetical protein
MIVQSQGSILPNGCAVSFNIGSENNTNQNELAFIFCRVNDRTGKQVLSLASTRLPGQWAFHG